MGNSKNESLRGAAATRWSKMGSGGEPQTNHRLLCLETGHLSSTGPHKQVVTTRSTKSAWFDLHLHVSIRASQALAARAPGRAGPVRSAPPTPNPPTPAASFSPTSPPHPTPPRGAPSAFTFPHRQNTAAAPGETAAGPEEKERGPLRRRRRSAGP